jgi:hypothetical protein
MKVIAYLGFKRETQTEVEVTKQDIERGVYICTML